MDEGKLKIPLLKELIKLKGSENKGIVLSGNIGSDVSIINIEEAKDLSNLFYDTSEDVYLIEKSDPITFPTSEPGKYLVIVNANDVSCAGAVPFGILSTIIAPPSTKFEDLLDIQKQIHKQCEKQGIAILGGHTEISPSVNTLIISGHMIGFVPKDYLVPNKLSIGEKIIVVGYAGAEGTGIIIQEAGKIITSILEPSETKKGEKIGSQIHISDIALNINKKFKPSLIHDATEGGIYGALTEIVAFSDIGIKIIKEPIISDITLKLAKFLKINPFRLISSGAIILSTSESKAKEITEYLTKKQIPNRIIGEVTKEKGIVRYGDTIIQRSVGDEITIALRTLEGMKNEK